MTSLIRRVDALRGPWFFPVVVAILIAGLSIANLNGSSLGVYGTGVGQSESEADVLAGSPRPIRSDEWLVRTPWMIGHDRAGLPELSAGGIGVHDASLLGGLPTESWELLLRPHTIPYVFLDAERAFAVEWWFLVGVQVLGVYGLVFALTKQSDLSAIASLLLLFSPVTQWWTSAGVHAIVGYGSAATAFLLWAYRSQDPRRRAAMALISGVLLASFAATLYPPWQVGTALVAGAVAIGAVAPDLMDPTTRKPVLRNLAAILTLAIGVAASLFGAFLLSHWDGIQVLSGTVYPGNRSGAEGGASSILSVLSAPFDSFAAQRQFTQVNATNQSENASAILFLVPAGVAAYALSLEGRLTSSIAPMFRGVLIVGGALLAWTLLPLPAGLGQFLLLNRIEAARVAYPLAFASVMALVLLVAHLRETNRTPSIRIAVGAVVALLAPYGWAAGRYNLEGELIDHRLAALFLLVIGAGVALMIVRPRSIAGGTILVLFALWQASLINPLQLGTDPLTENELALAVERRVSGDLRDSRWVLFSGNVYARGTLTASGVDNLSSVSPYPDFEVFTSLDPTQTYIDEWNRYAHVGFERGAGGGEPSFVSPSPDTLVITIDPCGEAFERLEVDYILTDVALSCGELVDTVDYGPTPMFIYGV